MLTTNEIASVKHISKCKNGDIFLMYLFLNHLISFMFHLNHMLMALLL